MLINADEWGTVLCFSGSCTTRIWSPCSLSVSSVDTCHSWLTIICRVDGLVQLAGTSDWCPVGGLCAVSHGPGGGIDIAPKLCSSELAGLLTHRTHHAHTWLHQQHADQVDRQLQLCGINVQHHCLVYSNHPHTCWHQQGAPESASIHSG